MKVRKILNTFILLFVFNICFGADLGSNIFNISIERYLTLPDNKLSIGVAALIISREVHTNVDFKACITEIDRLASQVYEYIGTNKNPDEHVAALNTVLFRDNSYRYDTNDYYGLQSKNHTLAGVITSKTGTCFTLPLLYLTVAERCGFPIYAVTAPQHTFARYVISNYFKQGKHFEDNIEVTDGGGWTPDVIYIDDMKIPLKSFTNGVYLSTLTKREYIGYLVTAMAIHALNEKKDEFLALKYLEMSVTNYNKNVLGWLSIGKLSKKIYRGIMVNLSYGKDRASLLANSRPNVSIPGRQSFGDFESQNKQKTFSKQDRLNMALSIPESQSMSPELEADREKDRILADANYYYKKSEKAFDKVDHLGLAPLLEKDYWKKKLNSDDFLEKKFVSPEGMPIGKKTYIMNGIEYELTPEQFYFISDLAKKYKAQGYFK